MQDTEGLATLIAYVYYKLGRIAEAEKICIEELLKLQSSVDEDRSSYEYALASIYAIQGDHEKALEHLTEFAEIESDEFILIDPLFESLRDDPEFLAIVKKVQKEKAELRDQIKEMEERGELDL
jgi:tetratricopeptide (TPR) repeat protein